ncbi:hypothetical protein [Larkinella soli]|uniref:hypothetical protein n=1 Tax=Larkinella soli TaxID=1770527 RepID=UPI000FFC4EB0|nr:hypothetical protein [Larkinella soli]
MNKIVFTAKRADLSLIISELLDEDFRDKRFEEQRIYFYAEAPGGVLGIDASAKLCEVLNGPVEAWNHTLEQDCPVQIPVVKIEIYADEKYYSPLRSFPIPVYLLRKYVDPTEGLTGSAILRMIDTYFGGFSGTVDSKPIVAPQTLQAA